VIRRLFVWLHRWAGLAMAVLLILVGLTDSLLAFKTDLERLICPRIYATPRPGVPPLDLATLAERAEILVPQGRVVTVDLLEPDQALVVFEPREDPATGKPYELDFVGLLVDRWSGEELGRRRPGDLSQGLITLMEFIYDLHVTLELGAPGVWVLGVVALVWTIGCFIGFYLTLPISSDAFWRRRKPAWLVKWKAGAYRLNFDLHRAGGLRVSPPMPLVFAWSSVMLNLPQHSGNTISAWLSGAHGRRLRPSLPHLRLRARRSRRNDEEDRSLNDATQSTKEKPDAATVSNGFRWSHGPERIDGMGG